MTFIAKLNRSGRFTIPVQLRRHLKLRPGDQFELDCRDDGLVLRRLRTKRRNLPR